MKVIRNVIQTAINNWFSQPIVIGERTMQILETAIFCEDGWIDDAEIYTKAIEYQPSLTNLFLRAGISETTMSTAIDDMKRRTTYGGKKLPASDLHLKITLEYQLPKNSTQFKIIKQRNKLTTADLISGLLRAKVEKEVGSVLAQHLLDAADASIQSDYWTLQNRKYIDNLIKRINALENLDIDLSNQQFVLYWDGSFYRFRPFGAFGGYDIDYGHNDSKNLWISRGNVIQHIKRFPPEAFEQLEYLINRDSKEERFQKFFERYPEFLLALGGGNYINLHPQVVIHQDDGSRIIPDFFLETIGDNLCDICDLKRATMILAQKKLKRPGFRAAVNEGIAQLEYYRNWFEDRQNREAFYKKTGLRAYRPKVILVIGRNLDYYTDIERIRREGLLPAHAEVLTYDDILKRAQSYVRLVTD